jgi:hypothetical protein
MIILEFKDYRDVREELEMLNEGLFDKIGDWLRKTFKGNPYYEKVNQLIGPEQIEQMINQKTGDLDAKYTAYIEKGDIAGLFKELEGFKTGQMWLQSIKFMKDGFMKADKGSSMKVAGEKVSGKPEDELSQPTEDANKAGAAAKESLDKRAQEFDTIYKKAKETVAANIKKQVETFMKTDPKLAEDQKREGESKKSKYAWVKPMFDKRIASTELALTMLEYDIKKVRWDIKGLEPLKAEMAEDYKNALKFSKELDAAMKNTQTEESGPAQNLKAFVEKEYNVGDSVDWFYADKTDPNKKGNPAGKAEIVEFKDDVIVMKQVDSGKQFNASYAIFRNWIMPAKKGTGLESPQPPAQGQPKPAAT